MLNITTSLGTVGLFSVATQFSSIIELVQVNTNNTYMPGLFKTLDANEIGERNNLSKTICLLLLVYNAVFLMIGLFAQEAIIIMTPLNYRLAWTIVPVLAVANGIKSIYYVYLGIIMYYKDLTKKLFLASITGSITNILFNYFCTNILAMKLYGPAISLVMSNMVLVLIIVLIGKKKAAVYNNLLKLNFSIIVTIITLAIGIIPSYIWWADIFSLINVGYKVLVFAVYGLYVYFFFVKKMLIKH